MTWISGSDVDRSCRTRRAPRVPQGVLFFFFSFLELKYRGFLLEEKKHLGLKYKVGPMFYIMQGVQGPCSCCQPAKASGWPPQSTQPNLVRDFAQPKLRAYLGKYIVMAITSTAYQNLLIPCTTVGCKEITIEFSIRVKIELLLLLL